MTKTEIELNNHIIEQGWNESAASAERLSSFLSPRMAALAIADTDLESYTDEEFEALVA